MEEEMTKLLDLFRKEGVEYRLYEHEPVYTSEEASRVRGVEAQDRGEGSGAQVGRRSLPAR